MIDCFFFPALLYTKIVIDYVLSGVAIIQDIQPAWLEPLPNFCALLTGAICRTRGQRAIWTLMASES